MLAGILIVALSLALLVYWFRYSCILILRSRSEIACAAAEDSRFSYSEVLVRLKSETTLDTLEASLDRDFRVLRYLVQHAAGLELESLEDRLLMFDYRVMRAVYRLSRTAAPQQARNALVEMASVLAVIAQRIGEQAGVQPEA